MRRRSSCCAPFTWPKGMPECLATRGHCGLNMIGEVDSSVIDEVGHAHHMDICLRVHNEHLHICKFGVWNQSGRTLQIVRSGGRGWQRRSLRSFRSRVTVWLFRGEGRTSVCFPLSQRRGFEQPPFERFLECGHRMDSLNTEARFVLG